MRIQVRHQVWLHQSNSYLRSKKKHTDVEPLCRTGALISVSGVAHAAERFMQAQSKTRNLHRPIFPKVKRSRLASAAALNSQDANKGRTCVCPGGAPQSVHHAQHTTAITTRLVAVWLAESKGCTPWAQQQAGATGGHDCRVWCFA